MNTVFLTGYVAEDAVRRVRAGAGHEVELSFKVGVKDAFGREHFLYAIVDAPHLVEEYEPLLSSGRAFILQGEVITRDYLRHGVAVSKLVSFRASRMEFPSRSGVKKDADDEGDIGVPSTGSEGVGG